MSIPLKRLHIQMEEQGIEALLVTSDVNISYLSDFASSDSWALITPQKRIYITDFRYILEAKSHLKDFSIHKINGSIFEAVAKLAKSLKVKRVCFEAKNLTFAEFHKTKSFLAKKNIGFIPKYDFVESIRAVKIQHEVSKIKKAISLTNEAFRFIKSNLKPGIKESQLALRLEEFALKKGTRFSFDPIIASGPNSAFPHAKISDRIIRNNEAVMVDIGLDYQGYKSDLTRVFFLGKIPLHIKRIHHIVLEAQTRAIQAVSAGVKASSVDAAARNFIAKNKLGKYFGHALGHGLGLNVHEAPSISSKNGTLLEEGMVFTIEPAVYIPREFGIRIEDIVLVKQGGSEVLSGSTNY